MKKLLFFAVFLFSALFTPTTFAGGSSFVSIVNPVRGDDFWDIKDQKPETAVFGQISILNKFNFPATWLLRFDALDNKNITMELEKRPVDEKGLFLEITPTLTEKAGVEYHKSDSWHSAGSAFLTGYERGEREKLIDTVFEKFKSTFGIYPVSVGAWWIDSYSLGYMQKKYGINSALIVADQYSTDNYQIWGQYFSTPYYPSRNNALHPAQVLENKLDVVIMQWAARDPMNGYGNGVMESTFSIQANDYLDYHDLNTKYFSSLVDIYTKQRFNQFGHLVVGLENSYSWSEYSAEYENQIKTLLEKKNANQLAIVSMKDFAVWYKKNFPKLSPSQLIIADDPLGSFRKTIWFMNPYYRAGWFSNQDGSVFRDIRQYIDGEEELCFRTRCDSVNFATSATRVLDDVSFGRSWFIDQGKISNFKAEKEGEEFVISYTNEAGNLRKIGLMPRDIRIDEKIFSIDGAILNVTKQENMADRSVAISDGYLKWSFASVILKIGKFLIFLILTVVLPGLVFTSKTFKGDVSPILRIFVSAAVGFAILTLLFYITGLLKIKPVIFIYILIIFVLFTRNYSSSGARSFLKNINNLTKIIVFRKKVYILKVCSHCVRTVRNSLLLILMILAGTIFQIIPTLKSGLSFAYGAGFWGPNSHDGVWHLALINQLVKSVPPENPVYSGTILKNYHFFYDLLVAATNYLSGLPVSDLVFRFYPVVFSLMLGVGSYYLVMKLFEGRIGAIRAKIAAVLGLYLVYFAGSLGWIVEFLRERHFGGESAFWVNQAVSFNLNPPFAISLVIIIALLLILFTSSMSKKFLLAILLAGTLIGFKSYGASLVLATMLFVGLIKKQISYLVIVAGALLISVWIFLSNFDTSSSLLAFAPFWFIHSMIDSPDRVGWVRLSLAREVGFTTNNWLKYISAEVLSLLIFIAGNLGLRVISLISLIKIKNIVKDEKFLFMFIFSFLSFLIPILFVQSGNPWNTIQFSYYGLYIASITSGIVLSSIISQLPRYVSISIVLIVLILSPINSVVTASGYLTNKPHAFVSSKELEGLQFLSGQPDGAILTYPYDEKLKQRLPEPWPMLVYDSTAYVSALSKKSVYLEDESQNQILLTDYKKRLVASKDFFSNSSLERSKFLEENYIRYVYIPKIYNVRLDESTNLVENIFENVEVVIYQVQQ